MRVLTTTLALAVAFPALVSAGPCEFDITCLNIDSHSFPPCSPAEAAEAELVGPALQACEDIAYFFTKGGRWPHNDKPFFCNVNSPCGSLVPYLTNVRSYADACDKFKPFYPVMQTFHGFCRDQPAAELPGDNGLLASLKTSSTKTGSRPTPAPSRPIDAETPEPIPNSETPAPSSTTAEPRDNTAGANSKTASDASALASTGAAVVGITTTMVLAALNA